MQFDQDLYGSVPVLKKYQYAATIANVGVPYLIPAAAGSGLVISTTTGATDMVGCNIDKGLNILNLPQSTYTTTQGTGANSAERVVTMIINPFAVWSGKMSGGATEDTALALQIVTTASSGGTAITTGATWTSGTEYADGVVWGYSGANAGRFRKITSSSSTAGTVTVPFDYATVVGDNFLRAPHYPMFGTTIQLTTNLYQVNSTISVGTGAPLKCIELRLRDSTDSGQTNSFVLFISNSHALNLA